MIKPTYLIKAVTAVMIFSICNSPNKEAGVDTYSSATLHENCKFTLPIAVTATTATVEWQEMSPTDGTAYIFHGTSLANLTKRNVTTDERMNQKLVLSGLTPNTTYYLRLVTTYQDKVPYGDTATIKTLQ